MFIVERLLFQASSRCDRFYANDARPPIKNLGSACAPPSRTDAHAAFDEKLRWLAREVPCLLKIEFKAPRPLPAAPLFYLSVGARGGGGKSSFPMQAAMGEYAVMPPKKAKAAALGPRR